MPAADRRSFFDDAFDKRYLGSDVCGPGALILAQPPDDIAFRLEHNGDDQQCKSSNCSDFAAVLFPEAVVIDDAVKRRIQHILLIIAHIAV